MAFNPEPAGGSGRVTHTQSFDHGAHAQPVNGYIGIGRRMPRLHDANTPHPAAANESRYNASEMPNWVMDPGEVGYGDAAANREFEREQMRRLMES